MAAQVTTETVTTGTAERRELTAARWSVVEVHAVVPLARARFNSGEVVSVGRRERVMWCDLGIIRNGLDWGWRELGEGEARQRK